MYSQFQNGSGKEETQPTDGENDENDIDKTEIPEFEINGGFDPDENKPRNRNVKFSPTDYENFEIFFERYKVYKRDIRSSGVVNKDTDDRELFNWYRRIKDLIGDGELPEELMQRLVEIDFPIGDGWEKTRLMLWDKRFETLLEYKSKFNPNSQITHVPQFRDKRNPYFPLGSWCATQKQRRKGNCTPIWTEYEEKKMESIHFLWEILDIKGRTNDDDWADHLVELEEYYMVSKNFKTIPHQNTFLGKWLNEQLTMKLTGTRGKVKKFLNPIREEMLGDLLKRNGIDWEWRKQKERESIEKFLSFWTELNELEIQSNPKAMTETTRRKISLCKKKIAELKRSSKKWHNARNKWKIEILDKVGFPYPKII